MVIQRARGRTRRVAYRGPGPSCANASFFLSLSLFDMAKDVFYLFFSEEGDEEDASEHGQKCFFLLFFCVWFFFFSSLPTAEPAASVVTQRTGWCCGVCKRYSSQLTNCRGKQKHRAHNQRCLQAATSPEGPSVAGAGRKAELTYFILLDPDTGKMLSGHKSFSQGYLTSSGHVLPAACLPSVTIPVLPR